MIRPSPSLATLALAGILAPGLRASNPKPKHAKTAVEDNADRQIQNAVYAGEGDVALQRLRQRVVDEPASVSARLDLAAAYEERGAPELAIDHYRIAAEQYNSEAGASRLAKALEGLSESEQAGNVLVRFCDSHRDASSGILSETAILFDEMNQFQIGERYHLRALTAALSENAPNQDFLHNNLGFNWIQQKRFREAQAEIRSSLELNPHSNVAHNNLARALASAPDATDAELKEAILHWQSTSGPSAAHNNLAAVFMDQNRVADAKRELSLALGFDRNNRAALANLGELGTGVSLPPIPTNSAAATRISFWKRIFPGRRRKADALASASRAQHSHSTSDSTVP